MNPNPNNPTGATPASKVTPAPTTAANVPGSTPNPASPATSAASPSTTPAPGKQGKTHFWKKTATL